MWRPRVGRHLWPGLPLGASRAVRTGVWAPPCWRVIISGNLGVWAGATLPKTRRIQLTAERTTSSTHRRARRSRQHSPRLTLLNLPRMQLPCGTRARSLGKPLSAPRPKPQAAAPPVHTQRACMSPTPPRPAGRRGGTHRPRRWRWAPEASPVPPPTEAQRVQMMSSYGRRWWPVGVRTWARALALAASLASVLCTSSRPAPQTHSPEAAKRPGRPGRAPTLRESERSSRMPPAVLLACSRKRQARQPAPRLALVDATAPACGEVAAHGSALSAGMPRRGAVGCPLLGSCAPHSPL